MGKKKEAIIENNQVFLTGSLENLQKMENNKVIQGNPLIEAIFVQPFTEFELKVLCLISQYINQHKCSDEEKVDFGILVKVCIKRNSFCQVLNIDPKNFYKQMNSLSKNLIKKHIVLTKSEQVFYSTDKTDTKKKSKKQTKVKSLITTLFPCIGYENEAAIFYMSPILKPYLQHLKMNFTSFSLDYVIRMGSSYAIKIYQLLKQYQAFGKRQFLVEELKTILGIQHLYVDRFRNFRNEVLVTAQRHINEFTDLKINFQTETQGRKVVKIIFNVSEKHNQLQQAVKAFKKDMDIAVSLTPEKEVKESWENSKKNVKLHEDFFNAWLEEKVESYIPNSFEKLTMSNNTLDGRKMGWYEKTMLKLQNHQQVIKQNFEEEQKNVDQLQKIIEEFEKDIIKEKTVAGLALARSRRKT